jgi:HEAT repeat protein/cyclophilin family peptidyl-prolyl cis-trans isomerase
MSAISWPRAIALLALTAGCVSAPHRQIRAPDRPEPPQVEAYAAILRAVELREVDDAFRATLTDPSPAVRARAARALGRLGRSEGRTELETLLADPAASVRSAAVFGLALLEGRGAASRLESLISDPDPGVRASVAWSLGRYGTADAIEVLIRDPDPGVVAEACRAASRFPGSTVLTDALLELSGSGVATSAAAATYSLARLASGHDAGGGILRVADRDRERIRKRLVELAGHADPEVRMQVAAGLAVPAGDAESAALGALVKDLDSRVRINAVRSLAYPGAEVEPDLLVASRDPAGQVTAALLDGLGVVGTSRAASLLLDFIGPNRPAWIRARAIASLGRVDQDRLLSLTPRFLLDDDPRIGAAALRGLTGRRDPKTLGFLRRAIVDDSPAIRGAAVGGLAEAGVGLEEMRPAVGSPDPAVRAAVARAVGSRGFDGVDVETGFEMLARLWELSVADGIPAARLAVLDAVAVGPSGEPAREILMAAVADPDRRVRMRAAELLRSRFDLDLSDRVGPPSGRALADYRAIATWSRTRRAAVVTVRRAGFLPGRFTLALDAEHAPLTAWNFARLAEDGFYDGLTVFDLAPNVSVRTGDPRGDGLGGPGYSLPGEPSLVPVDAGTLAMDPEGGGSSGSRWLVVHSVQPELVGRVTTFGRVVQSLPGVALLVVPDDVVVSVEVYEGDGTEPLPPLEGPG